MEPRDLPVSAALAALSVTVALAFARVLDGSAWIAPLVAAAVAPHVVAALTRLLGRGSLVELGASAATLFVGVLVATPGGPDPSAVLDRVGAGWDIVHAHTVRLPPHPGIIVLAAVVVWTVAGLADFLAFRRDAALGAVAPGVVVVIWCTALGSHEDRWLTVGAFGAAAVLFLALQHQRLLDRHRTRLGPPARSIDAPRMLALGVVVGVLAIGLGVAGAVSLPDADRPLIDADGLRDDAGGARSYRTSIPPLLDVGDKLRQQDVQQLFTVAADAPDYWRITALDEYRPAAGGQWALTAEGEDAVGQGLDETVPRDALVQRYRIGPLSERWMPAAYRPVRVSRGDTLVVRASSTLVSDRPVAGLRYTVASDTPNRSLDDVERATKASSAVPDELRQYTALPPDLPPVVAQTARDVVAGVDDPVAQATALRDYFRGGAFSYDTTVALGDDEAAVVTFLRDRRGFCVQFATAYALMARSLGVPARIAVGFTPGTLGADGRYSVTNHDAHAWPELWFAGVGWTHVFDPTPAADAPGGSNLPEEIAPAPSTTQTGAGTPAPTTPPSVAPSPSSGDSSTPPATAAPQGGGVEITADEPASNGGDEILPFVIGGLVVVLAVGPVLVVLAWKRRRRALRRHESDPRQAIVGAWREAMDALTDHRVATSSAETPLEIAARVPAAAGPDTAPPLRSLAAAYTEARYATTAPDAEHADAAWRDVDDFRDALDRSEGLWLRARARLSPRTLGRPRERV